MSGDRRFPHELTTGSFGCSSCGLDFASEEAFDQHRHFSGRQGDWARRSCVDVQSHPDWVLGSRSRWTTQKLSSQARKLRRHHSTDSPSSETLPHDSSETPPDTPSES
jgi:hypothetical protein